MKPELALALIIKRWRDWQNVAHYQLPNQQEKERLNFIRLYKFYKKMREKENASLKSQIVISHKRLSSPISNEFEKKRKKIDDSHKTKVDFKNHKRYFDYFNMEVETFEELLKLVQPLIKKQHVIKNPVSARTRLQICLRYLASGESMIMISYEFNVGCNTVSKIVTETCEAIWKILKNSVLPLPNKDLWKEKAQAFQNQWDFPHCVGVITGRQLLLQTAFPTEPKQYNKKDGLIFFAIIDANLCFSLINVDIENTIDGHVIFSLSQIGNDLQMDKYNFPKSTTISENNLELPYVLVGGKDFPLMTNLLKPYENNDNLELSEQEFNYKIEHINKCAKNAFDILINKWKIFKKKFSTNVANTKRLVRACVCLHNFLMIKERNMVPKNRKKYSLINDKDLNAKIQNCAHVHILPDIPSEKAEEIRDIFKCLFCEDKAILLDSE